MFFKYVKTWCSKRKVPPPAALSASTRPNDARKKSDERSEEISLNDARKKSDERSEEIVLIVHEVREVMR
jgi:hypothetical protein